MPMVQDSRWPFIPFIIIRSVQALFAIIILGITGYIVGHNDDFSVTVWSGLSAFSALGLTASLLTLIWIGISFALFFMNMLLPLAVVCVDAFLLVLWLAAMAGTAAKGGISDNECTFYIDSYYLTYWKSKPCEASKGSFVMELLIMILFIVTTVFASITLHRYRYDLRGNKHKQGLPPTSGAARGVEEGEGAGMPVDEQKMEYQQQPIYEQQAMHDGGFYQPPQQTYVQQQTVSPVATPAPEQQGAYSTVSSMTTPGQHHQ